LSDELTGKFESIEKKVKLSNLLSGKKFADLELTIGKLEEKFKEFSSDIPKLNERAEEIEDLLNIINLGLINYKKKFENINARFETIEKVPENVKKSMFEYEKKLRALNENIENISTGLGTFKNLKEEVTKAVEGKILPEIQALKERPDTNKLEIEHIKRDLDVFSSSVKSFERTVQLTNLDRVIDRFDSIEKKIMDIQVQVEGFRKTFSGISLADVDVNRLEEELKNLSSIMMEKVSEMNEAQMNLKIINQKMEDLNFFETISKLNSELKDKERMILDDRIKIEELRARMDRISAMSIEHLEPIKKFDKEIQEKMASLDLTSIEEVYRKSEQMYNAMVERIAKLKDLDKKLRVFEAEARARTLPPDVNDILTKVHDRLENVEDRYNKVLNVLKSEIKTIKSESAKPELEELRKRIERLQKVLASRDKNLTEYRKGMEKRLSSLDKKKEIKIPKEILDKVNTLNNTVSFLTADNKELRKLAREIRMAQLEAISTKVFTGLMDKVKTLENKITDFEKGIGKEVYKEAVAPETLKGLFERIEALEKKITDFEKMTGKGIIDQKKEYESLMNLKVDLEKQMSDIKKKLTEESSVQPVILE